MDEQEAIAEAVNTSIDACTSETTFDLTELRVGLSKTIEWFGQNSKYWETKNIGNYDV